MKCKICNQNASHIFDLTFLGKHTVHLYHCSHCDFIQTEEPYWLDEAYSDAISKLDVGLVYRNLMISDILEKILLHFDQDKVFLDYAGGYGLLVRIMRDKGFRYYRQDKFCKNIFSENFDISDLPEKQNFSVVTAFEFLEHTINPLQAIEEIFSISETILFTTELHPSNLDCLMKWWYFVPESGQHISFYSRKTLQTMARLFNKKYISIKDIHILTSDVSFWNYCLDIKKMIDNNRYWKKTSKKKHRTSLLSEDYEFIKKMIGI